MAAGDYILHKMNSSSDWEEKTVLAESGKALGFDIGLNPKMIDVGDLYSKYQRIFGPDFTNWTAVTNGSGASVVKNASHGRAQCSSSVGNSWASLYVAHPDSDVINGPVLWSTKAYDVDFVCNNLSGSSSAVYWFYIGIYDQWGINGPTSYVLGNRATGFRIDNNDIKGFKFDNTSFTYTSSLGTSPKSLTQPLRLRFKSAPSGDILFSVNGGSFGNALTNHTSNINGNAAVIAFVTDPNVNFPSAYAVLHRVLFSRDY